MYHNSLTKMLDQVFTFPHELTVLNDSFVYDSISTEKDGSSKISVVVPGFSKDDLELEIIDNLLTLSSKNNEKQLKRTWKLSSSVDTKKVSADCKNGILSIMLPLKSKSDKVYKIQIS